MISIDLTKEVEGKLLSNFRVLVLFVVSDL